MPIYNTKDNKWIIYYDDTSIKKYRPLISKEIISKFGKGPFKEDKITEILFYTFEWYCNSFLQIINDIKELAFYQGVFLLHEFTCELFRENKNKSPIKELNYQDFALYRRVLRLILEQACDLKLSCKVSLTPNYLKSNSKTIEELIYLGDFIYVTSNLLASQHQIEDCIDLKFTHEDQYYFIYKHHYGKLIEILSQENKLHVADAIVGVNEFTDFIDAIKDCLNIDYDKACRTIQLIHENFKEVGGKTVLDEWFIYPKNFKNLFNVSYQQAEKFFKGLTLSKHNKLSLKEAVYRPHELNRYLFRPFLIWNVDGKDLTIVGDGIFISAISSLCSNAFGWNKYPKEWGNKCFKNYIKIKTEQNDKILENAIEKSLSDKSLVFDRNLTHLKAWNNQNVDIDNENCGEIDFIYIFDDKVYIADCKHLIARYDMNNYRHDFDSFVNHKKSFNETLKRKIEYLNINYKLLEEHFQVITGNKKFSLPKELEGVFIINTPTFYMYNADYRIYTIKSFNELINHKFVDKVYHIIIDDSEEEGFIFTKYPYFKKPKYLVFNDFE